MTKETYEGGKVEAVLSGVFRSDLPVNFKIEPEAVQELIDDIDEALAFGLHEKQTTVEEVANYSEVREAIVEQLIELRDHCNRQELPRIYHLDVSAMYPNIILTNRLQPTAIVDEGTCASCDFNRPGKQCQRHMNWVWRGNYMPNTRNDFEQIKSQLEVEGGPSFTRADKTERAAAITQRLEEYCKKVYNKRNVEEEVTKTDIVCQRENPFYVDTVRGFRDRRYEYKRTLKVGI